MRKIRKIIVLLAFLFLIFIVSRNKISFEKDKDTTSRVSIENEKTKKEEEIELKNVKQEDSLLDILEKKMIDIIKIIIEKREAELKSIKLGNPVYIRLFKEEKKLEIWIQNDTGKYVFYKEFNICTFSGGLGPKKKEGDRKSPEGFYNTKKSFLNPNSSYHLSFNIGYPNEYDKSHGYTGSLIMIHGNCVSLGCYAMTDEYIEEIYGLVEKALDNGQKKINIDIFPFKMTESNMEVHEDDEYYDFWKELKPGYDYFQMNKIPPKMIVENKKYKLIK
ncbi:L,D-transpeptidase family protein [Fusobacterium sp. PH5-44]|uniref:L,D-transpeptidase family protein n=1 Tax=unclassified Fusobacterium TaxID=2648384 RepID=UPI003D236BBD